MSRKLVQALLPRRVAERITTAAVALTPQGQEIQAWQAVVQAQEYSAIDTVPAQWPAWFELSGISCKVQLQLGSGYAVSWSLNWSVATWQEL